MLCLVVYIEMSASLHGGAEWPHAGILDDKMKPKGGGHVICHCFMQWNVYLMLSMFYRCMGITCNIRGGVSAPAVAAHPEPPGALPGWQCLARPSSSPPPPSRRNRIRQGPGRSVPAFVVTASAVEAHPEQPEV
jgi:hypothetical protein